MPFWPFPILPDPPLPTQLQQHRVLRTKNSAVMELEYQGKRWVIGPDFATLPQILEGDWAANISCYFATDWKTG